MSSLRVFPRAGSTAALGLALALVTTSNAVSAQDPCKPIWDNSSLPPAIKLQQLAILDCLGGSNDEDPSAIPIRASIATLPDQEDAVRLTHALDAIGAIHEDLIPQIADTSCRDEIAVQLALVNHAMMTQQLTPSIAPCSGRDGVPYQTTCWEFDSSGPAIPALPSCSLAASDGTSLMGAAAVVRLAKLVNETLDAVFAPLKRQYHAEAIELHGRWWTYFHKTRSQYPWEVAINSLDFEHKISKGDRSKFQWPPNHQWIVLHPEATLEYFGHAPDGKQLKPTLTVELVGFNRWKWTGEKASRAFGFAAVANYSDVEAVKDWQFGAIVHVAHVYSFGATRASGETGFFVSADLATFIMDKKKTGKAFLAGLKGAN